MCAKTARNNLGLATSHIPSSFNQDFRSFVDRQKTLYKTYSGNLLGCGIVASKPKYDATDRRWYADIDHLRQFSSPININDFKSFISVSQTNAVTNLTDDQWERLKWLITMKNPGFYPNVIAPDVKILEQEFEDSIKKIESKPLNQLKKAAEKNASMPSSSVVQTKVYSRDPAIAAYVKKRANGRCQLCGSNAPFNDENGRPYLECHHIVWLSKGGIDSVDNCVALCPNCHRKMHVLGDENDIMALKAEME